MASIAALFFFVTVPAAVAMLGESLRYRGVRWICFLLLVPMLVTIGTIIFGQADGTLGGVASVIAFVCCAGLSVLGLAAPKRFFWAFRVLSAGICAGVWVLAIFESMFASRLAVSRNDPWSGDATAAWMLAFVVGLPCLHFARKGRLRPTKQRLHVVMKQSSIPPVEVWQKALSRWGFDLKLQGEEELHQHSGRFPVDFQGNPAGFQFDVAPLSKLVADHELHEGAAKQFSDGFVSANFRFEDEHEEMVALMAAAALAKLTDGRLYSAEHETWSDGDDAIEAAQDQVLPRELHVLAAEERVPTLEQWRQSLKDVGIAVELPAEYELRTHLGFFPVLVDGQATGFVFGLSPAEYVVGGDQFPADEAPREVFGLTVAADFRFAEGRQAAAAAMAAAVFAQITGGYVYDPRQLSFLAGKDAIQVTQSRDDETDDS